MAREFAKSFYDSKSWKECRQAYIGSRILIDGGKCEICKIEQGYIIHHKIELTESNINNPDVALNPSNLMYVCHNCHNFVHSKDFSFDGCARLPALFDESGQILPRSGDSPH
jgi:hypothetical protein